MRASESPLFPKPLWFLSYARAFACASAVGGTAESSEDVDALSKMFQRSPSFNPQAEINYSKDCRPFVLVPNYPEPGQYSAYMPAWARGGVRYFKPGFDLTILAPESFYVNYWPVYQSTFGLKPGSDGDKIFEQLFVSMAEDEDAILDCLGTPGRLVLDSAKIRRMLA